MKLVSAVLFSTVFAGPAFAGDKYVVQPVQAGSEKVRYLRGEATVTLDRDRGAIQIQPLKFDRGGMSFAVAVLNDGPESANFDISNISISVQGSQVLILSRDELERKAKNRAMWSQIAVGLAGGLAAAAAGSQRDTYSATTFTRRGTYRTIFSGPSAAGQVQATALAAGAGVGIAQIQNQLDQTLEQLSADIVQLTTVDPGDSYGGRIVVSKVKFAKKGPTRVDMVVRWNGEDYPFAFQVARPGTPAPAFVPVEAPAAPPAEVVTPGV